MTDRHLEDVVLVIIDTISFSRVRLSLFDDAFKLSGPKGSILRRFVCLVFAESASKLYILYRCTPNPVASFWGEAGVNWPQRILENVFLEWSVTSCMVAEA